jgi:hypothetical protein
MPEERPQKRQGTLLFASARTTGKKGLQLSSSLFSY